jgi:hypothetical protein
MRDKLIKGILRQDSLYLRHFVQEYPSMYHKHSWKIEPEIWNEDTHVRDYIKKLVGYMRYPIIQDNFPLGVPNEDVPRNRWHTKLFEKYRVLHGSQLAWQVFEYLQKNKLSGNCYGKIIPISLDMLELFLGEKFSRLKKEIKETRKVMSKMGENYSIYKKMDMNQRVNLVREMEHNVDDILEVMSID